MQALEEDEEVAEDEDRSLSSLTNPRAALDAAGIGENGPKTESAVPVFLTLALSK